MMRQRGGGGTRRYKDGRAAEGVPPVPSTKEGVPLVPRLVYARGHADLRRTFCRSSSTHK